MKNLFLILLFLLFGNVVADAQVNNDVVLNEIMYHPSTEKADEEYIELQNRGKQTISLNGWRFSKGIRFTFPQISIPAGGFLVVSADLSAFQNKYPLVTNVIGGWDGILSNSGEEIVLEDAFGNEVDRVRYADEGDWARRTRGPEDRGHFGWVWAALHDGGGRSLELINPVISNDLGQNWASSTIAEGTPGQANSILSNNVPPIIAEAAHFPAVPRSTDNVVTTIRVIDENPEGTRARVHYRIDGEPTFSTLDMVDDGTRGDGISHDGIYAATLPKQGNNKVVEFYFEATDSSGLVRTWPAVVDLDGRTAQVANFLYQVDDSSSSPDLPIYRVIMTEAER